MLGRLLFPRAPHVGGLGALLLIGAAFFTAFASLTFFDSLVTFFTLLGLIGVWIAGTGRTRRGWILFALALGLALAFPARAGLYKCGRADGTVIYQEDPCPAGTELRDFERDPATLSVVPFRIAPGTQTRTLPREKPVKAASERKSRRDAERRGNASERKFLMPGIGEGEVVARGGRPDMSTGAGRKIVRWTYLPVPEDPGTITTLTFELGRLIEVERKVIRTP